VTGNDRRAALAAFLREKRAKVAPERVGFVRGARRRVAGLRREEIAELMDVSEVWYTRCETGKARFSLSALDRLAKALHLAPDEKRRLFELARPELSIATADRIDDAYSGAGRNLSELARFARRLGACSTTVEIGESATRALHQLVPGPTLAYWESIDRATGDLTFDAVHGHNADVLYRYRQPGDSIEHILPDLADGRFVSEPDLTHSPSQELRDRVRMVGTRSYAGVPIMRADGSCGIVLGFAKLTAHEASPLERETVGLIASIAELALGAADEAFAPLAP
jgi:transcriptional regulator with XRE-family HTH domain